MGAAGSLPDEGHLLREEHLDGDLGLHLDGVVDSPAPFAGVFRPGRLTGQLGPGDPDLLFSQWDEQVVGVTGFDKQTDVGGDQPGE